MGKKGKPARGSRAEPKKQLPKERRRPPGSSHGALGSQLAALGLALRSIEPDGNCLFRAMADQLWGEETRHEEVRGAAVAHLRANEETFRPFLAEDEPWEEYLSRMGRDGVWGGHLELQAASCALRRNIQVHQLGQAVWQVTNAPDEAQGGMPPLRLSYHDGEHYNSVQVCEGRAGVGGEREEEPQAAAKGTLGRKERLKLRKKQEQTLRGVRVKLHNKEARAAAEPPCQEEAYLSDKDLPPNASSVSPRALSVEVEPSSGSSATASPPSSPRSPLANGPEAARRVAWGTGCQDRDAILRALATSGDSIQGAVEALAEDMVTALALGTEVEAPAAEEEAPATAVAPSEPAPEAVHATPSPRVRTPGASARQTAAQPARNKRCPCGSKKKFKSCCGAAGGRLARRKEEEAAPQQRADADRVIHI
ncbi:hypothetical protein H632_c270p1 [Helicosporidium sp. ATCC 50920]|nr:hypothetical protein H632_c270p1 [Helicosporidium sp. ATCC 50920]|eukprot:KDD76319.1 hypothetical protein H632_c270p1 [Helicosporidium sp. ATCC 50920]